MGLRLAYLASEYPAISHTFILREAQGLRARGLEVETASIRRPENLAAMGEAERAEAAATFYVKSASLASVAGAHLALLLAAPKAWLRMLAAALRLVRRGPRSLAKGLFYLAEAGVLLAWMRRRGLRHVHVHFANPAATVALLAAASGQCDFSLSVHGPDEFYQSGEWLLADKVRAARMVRAISHFCAGQIKRVVERPHWDKVRIVRCGVDPARFPPRPDPANAAPALVCVGRLCPAKGQHLLLEALAGLARRGREFSAVLVGGGPDRDSLETLARDLGLADRVRFTGPVGQEEVRRAYAASDVFVLPSFAEGVPVVLMEAMSMTIPCVSTLVAGIPELIAHGEEGLLTPSGDAASLEAALDRLLADPGLRRRLGQAGRRKVLAAYDLDANLDRMAEFFREFLVSGEASP